MQAKINLATEKVTSLLAAPIIGKARNTRYLISMITKGIRARAAHTLGHQRS